MQIRIRHGRQRPSELETLCHEIGHQWPPRSPAEATTILNKAGTFTPTEVRQFLNTVGYTGFESYGELEDGLIRTGKPHFHDGDHSLTAEEHTAKFFDPTFTSTLLDGLRDKVAAATKNATADEIGSKPDGDKQELSFLRSKSGQTPRNSSPFWKAIRTVRSTESW